MSPSIKMTGYQAKSEQEIIQRKIMQSCKWKISLGPALLPFCILQTPLGKPKKHGCNGPFEQREDHTNLHRACNVSNVQAERNAELRNPAQFLCSRCRVQSVGRVFNALHLGQCCEARGAQSKASCRRQCWSNAIANRSSIKNSITSAIQTSSQKAMYNGKNPNAI